MSTPDPHPFLEDQQILAALFAAPTENVAPSLGLNGRPWHGEPWSPRDITRWFANFDEAE